jgi:hypothetical protein
LDIDTKFKEKFLKTLKASDIKELEQILENDFIKYHSCGKGPQSDHGNTNLDSGDDYSDGDYDQSGSRSGSKGHIIQEGRIYSNAGISQEGFDKETIGIPSDINQKIFKVNVKNPKEFINIKEKV